MNFKKQDKITPYVIEMKRLLDLTAPLYSGAVDTKKTEKFFVITKNGLEMFGEEQLDQLLVDGVRHRKFTFSQFWGNVLTFPQKHNTPS